jgi:glycosyltransferase involved in cell wall biosynthesis
MKVIHLITGLDLGGAERQLAALVQGKAINHIVISLKDEGILGKQIKDGGTPLYCLNLHKSLKGLWKLLRILREQKPDILQTWLYHADLLGLIFGKIAGIRRIAWNIRCSDMDLSRYSRLTAWVIKILKYLSPYPDAIICNSQAGQNFHAQLGYRPRQWVNISNGIDTAVFSPNPEARENLRRSLSIPQDALVIGMLARVDPMKDHTTFLKAMESLSTTHDNLYCLLAGKDTDIAQWPAIPPRLICLGSWDAANFLNALDIMVLSSAFGEGFPNVIGEAMACGIPVIATDVGDSAAIIQNPPCIVPVENVTKLQLALQNLIRLSCDERTALGKQGRARILEHYSLPAMRQNYEVFYKGLY